MLFSAPPVRVPVDVKDAKGERLQLSDIWKSWFQNLYSVVVDLQTLATGGVGYTVATLPAPGTVGRRAWVTDALAPTFLVTVVGGGAVKTPVFDNGVHWVAG